MKIQPAGSQATVQGPAAWFTGTVGIDPLFDSPLPATGLGASVSFTPGARTAWHTHPLGQVLIVTAGQGWVQVWGQEKQTLRAGDVVWIPPGEKHWHGATTTTAMTHIALVERQEGESAHWLEPVSDDAYDRAGGADA